MLQEELKYSRESSWVTHHHVRFKGSVGSTTRHAHACVCAHRCTKSWQKIWVWQKAQIDAQDSAVPITLMEDNEVIMRSWWDTRRRSPWTTETGDMENDKACGAKTKPKKGWRACLCAKCCSQRWCSNLIVFKYLPVCPKRNSPTDLCFRGVREIHAPPSHCLARGCRGSGLQAASCWAGWETASPSRPVPPSAHRLAELHTHTKKKKKGQAVWKKYWKSLKSLFIFYSRKNAKEFSLQTDFCSEFGLFLNSDQHPTEWGVMVFLTFLQPLKNTVDGLIQIECWA